MKTLTTKLRFGWTTGTCATAALNAAYTTMVTGTCPKRVTIVTPIGKQANLEVSMVELGTGWVKAGIIKDAGDDPDVTHGALICATVRPSTHATGVRFLRGDGVGIVTKAGLRDTLCSAPDSCGQSQHMWTGGWGWRSNMTRG